MLVRVLLAAVAAATPMAASPLAHADNPHDCELLKNNSGEIFNNAETAIDHMQKASEDPAREAAQDAASSIVYFRQAGDAAKMLAITLQAPADQEAATTLDQALHAQADAFEATIRGQGSKGTQDTLQTTSADLKAALNGFKQAVQSACGA